MARKTNTAKEDRKEFCAFSAPYEIQNPHWTADDKMCFFSLLLHTANGDLILHGLKLVYDKDGNGFIACASYKGDNGRYYQHYYVPFAPELSAALVSELEGM